MSRAAKRDTLKKNLLALVQQNGEGGRLPPERELSERLNVARETLRRALDELEAQGILKRKHGAGTFVTDQPWVKPLTLRSFSEDMAARGLTPSSEILSAKEVAANAKLAQRFKISPGGALYEVRRLRLADGEPMAIETSHLVKDAMPGFDMSRLAQGSLYAVLEREYGVVIRSASQQIQATVVTEAEATLLNVAPFSPALLVERQVQAATGEVIEHSKSLYRADRYSFEVNVARETSETDR
jgi:GntR family transcriptional regulator